MLNAAVVFSCAGSLTMHRHPPRVKSRRNARQTLLCFARHRSYKGHTDSAQKQCELDCNECLHSTPQCHSCRVAWAGGAGREASRACIGWQSKQAQRKPTHPPSVALCVAPPALKFDWRMRVLVRLCSVLDLADLQTGAGRLWHCTLGSHLHASVGLQR